MATAQRETPSFASLPESLLSCADERERQRVAELLSQLQTLDQSASEPAAVNGEETIAKTRNEAARLLGIHARTLSEWMTDPAFPGRAGKTGEANGYFPIEAIKRWRGITSTNQQSRNDAASELRLRKLAIETARREVDLEQRLGNLVSLEDVESTLSTALSTARSLIEEIPEVIAASIPPTKPKLKRMVARIARRKVRGVLAVLADAMREASTGDDDEEQEPPREPRGKDTRRGRQKGPATTAKRHGRRLGRGSPPKPG